MKASKLAPCRLDDEDDGGGALLIDEKGDEVDKGLVTEAFVSLEGGGGEMVVRWIDEMVAGGTLVLSQAVECGVIHGDERPGGVSEAVEVAVFHAKKHGLQHKDPPRGSKGKSSQCGEKLCIHTSVLHCEDSKHAPETREAGCPWGSPSGNTVAQGRLSLRCHFR